MTELAPIVLFTYNRYEHTVKTVEALKNNIGAADSDLYIFSDAAKNENDIISVQKLRVYLRSVNGFKKVTFIERDTNFGLAKNIIEGVGLVVNKHGKVIVLEDDIVTDEKFLKFMNYCLVEYRNEEKVWHISGWNYPINTTGLGDAFFWRVMSCWGWATWSDRWKYYEKNPTQAISTFTPGMVYDFDLEGSGVFWSQVVSNQQGRIDTWAIFWYLTIFKHGGLCLNTSISFVENIGHDGSGINSGISNVYSSRKKNNKTQWKLPSNVQENKIAVKRVIRYYKKMRFYLLLEAIQRKLKKIFKF